MIEPSPQGRDSLIQVFFISRQWSLTNIHVEKI